MTAFVSRAAFHIHVLGLAGLACALIGTPALSAVSAVDAAIADPARPAAERALDGDRKPQEVLRFYGVKAGDKVIERFPGGTYYTRLLSKIVGPRGKVYVALFKRADGSILDIDKAKSVEGPTVVLVPNDNATPTAPEPVDVVISQQNYHDLHVGSQASTAATAVNRSVFEVLRPGGTYVVIDHDARPGLGASDAPKTHRIEMSTARSEVEAAGFRFVGSSEALRNPADPRTATVSDPSVAGHTDRFMLKFRKP